MNFDQIRITALAAIASHDVLCELLVLKGGNALEIVHRIGGRGSLDLDFSIDGDVNDTVELEAQLKHAISDRFDSAGYVVFDTRFEFKPVLRQGVVPKWWGGYTFTFKIISRAEFKKHASNLDALRRNALTIDERHQRKFEIQISRSEYCIGFEQCEIDGFILHVYTPTMIGCEKLRAICQQMPEYEISKGIAGAARARDFYDIYMLASKGNVDFASDDSIEILKAMFLAKQVPIEFLENIGRDREYHRPDWPKVQNAVRGVLKPFDFYVDFVIEIVQQLKSLGVIKTP